MLKFFRAESGHRLKWLVAQANIRVLDWFRVDEHETCSKVIYGFRIYYLRRDPNPRRMAERRRYREAAQRINARART